MNNRINGRLRLLSLVWVVASTLVVGRLFYWQIWQAAGLQSQAISQYQKQIKKTGSRGQIFTADNHLLVGNQTVYRLFADPSLFDGDIASTSSLLWQKLQTEYNEVQSATQTSEIEDIRKIVETDWQNKLQQSDKRWVALKPKISQQAKDELAALNFTWLGFEPYQVRYYPEASMAAQVVGFVGKDEDGQDKGYFGIEGALDHELSPRSTIKTSWTDALGRQLLWRNNVPTDSDINGRQITLTIRRDIQNMIETQLKTAMERYQAASGEIIIMDPNTGAVLAMAAYPNYNPAEFYKFDTNLYKNPTIANLYEPGSTLKVLTVAAGLNEGVIKPDTECDICDGPIQIGAYSIKTWNDKYQAQINITDALAKSDNTAMVFVARLLGKEKFIEYIKNFGIGNATYIDLQEDTSTPFRDTWGDIHLATSSFGQGIVTNSLQLTRAVASIANGGHLVRPYIVQQVEDATGRVITTEPVIEKKVISAETASQVTSMMVNAAQSGEAQWTASSTHHIAGKTGTSQVATEGGYDAEKTIASFIGFAPAENPRFIMLVKLTEPKSSIWAAETAAPLWYKIANQLFLLLQIPPDKSSS